MDPIHLSEGDAARYPGRAIRIVRLGARHRMFALYRHSPTPRPELLAHSRSCMGDGLNPFTYAGIYLFARQRDRYAVVLLLVVTKDTNGCRCSCAS